MIDINEYKEEKCCTYKGEEYLVRDNGAVMRKARPTCRVRKLDNEWTFGKVNVKTGYLEIASERVHRIVAMAFLGDPPTKEHIVDHIDTNRQNNRPNNLRWLTRLENVVLNETTRKRIEYRIGVSIFDFLKNPQAYRGLLNSSEVSWMRRVTEEEAKNCLENTRAWLESKPKASRTNAKIGNWIFQPRSSYTTHTLVKEPNVFEDNLQSNITDSLTPTAKQKEWRTPTIFTCCPTTISQNPMNDYLGNLEEEKVFFKNQYGEAKIVQYVLNADSTIFAITFNSGSLKPFGLVEVTFENGFYLHASLGTFFTEDGAKKRFTLAQGLEWTGNDSIDDYC
ncbi:MAG: HNH endonuclease [Clostridia bacterium]|nr:HNH endonuclease [Clostridia bacterium]